MIPQNFFTSDRPLILASQSPQRAQILKDLEIPFTAIPSSFEEIIDPGLSPAENAEAFAEGKAVEVFEGLRINPSSSPLQGEEIVVVGVDTLVVDHAGNILGKPKDIDDARAMFQQKSEKTEKVISGICLATLDRKLIRHETAEIIFQEISNADIEHLLSLNEWKGKSGGISVEGKSSICIKSISGNFWNIVGFPIPTFLEMVREIMR